MLSLCTKLVEVKFTNKLTEEQKKKVGLFVKEGELEFTFQKIMKEPQLLVLCYVCKNTGMQKNKWFKKYKEIAPEQIIKECLQSSKYYYNINGEWESLEYKEEGIVFKEDEKISPAWYSWNHENWGTKWDASYLNEGWGTDETNGSNFSVLFNTAWGLEAKSIVTKLMRKVQKENLGKFYIKGEVKEPRKGISLEFEVYLKNNEVIYNESEKEMVEYSCDKCGSIHESKYEFEGGSCLKK